MALAGVAWLTRGTPAIKGWKEHELLRDLALGEESPEELAAKFDLAVQTVYDVRWKSKHRINAILAEWSNEFSDLWAVKKHARVADLLADHDSLTERMDELTEDAERATEVMRRGDPDAAPVRVPTREWRALVRDKAKLKAQIAHEIAVSGRMLTPLFYSGVNAQLHPARRLCDCRWNRRAWEVVGFG